MNLGNLIHKKLQTIYYDKIFHLGSTKEIHQYKNYFNVKDIMYASGNHPVSSISILLSMTIE
jgi:hypothetical protein